MAKAKSSWRLVVDASVTSSADGIIVSRDDEARRLFRQAAAQVGRLREIVWINPSDPDVMSWLEGERTATPGMKLGG